MTNLKICTKCKKELPATIDYFYKQKSNKDGFFNICKVCKIKRQRELYQKNKKEIAEYKKQYYLENKDEINRYKKQWYEDNKESILKRVSRHREENIEVIRENKRRYNEENPGNNNIRAQRYRTKKKELLATLTSEQWEDIKKDFDYKCAYCGKSLELEQEHFIPLSKGGEFSHNNIIPSCRACNASKSNKSFFKWYPKYKYHDKDRKEFILEYLDYTNRKTQQLSIL